jgi:hypothetical protein
MRLPRYIKVVKSNSSPLSGRGLIEFHDAPA